MRRIAHLTVLFGLLLLPACAHQPPPFSCNDYEDPGYRLQCQQMVLGLYMGSQNAMFNRWNAATHVEPITNSYQPVPVRPLSTPSTTCQFVGDQMFCQ